MLFSPVEGRQIPTPMSPDEPLSHRTSTVHRKASRRTNGGRSASSKLPTLDKKALCYRRARPAPPSFPSSLSRPHASVLAWESGRAGEPCPALCSQVPLSHLTPGQVASSWLLPPQWVANECCHLRLGGTRGLQGPSKGISDEQRLGRNTDYFA